MEVVSAEFVYGNAYSHSVITTKRGYSCWSLEDILRFKKIYSACGLLMRTLCTVHAAAGASSDQRTPHLPSVLQLVQAPTDEH